MGKHKTLNILLGCITWILISVSFILAIYLLISIFFAINYEILLSSAIIATITIIWGIIYLKYIYQYLNKKNIN